MAAHQKANKFCLSDYLLGLIVLEDPDIPARIDVARSREHLERAASNCPSSVLARFHLALLSHASGQSDQALEILKQLEETLPGNFLWPFFLGRVYEKLGWSLEAETSYRKALSVLPNHLQTLRSLFSLATNNHADQKALQLAQRLENLGSWDDLARFWIAHEDLERAESILERSLNYFPARLSVRLALFDLFVGLGKISRAAKLLAETEKLFPGRPLLLHKQAEFLDRQKDHAGAQSMRAKLVALAPWNLRARQALSAAGDLTGLRLAGERKIDAKELIAEYLKAKTVAAGHSALVLDQMAVQTDKDGSSVERMHTIVHIHSPEGLEHWGEIDQIPSGAVIEEIRTIKPDGRTINAEAIPGKDTISLRALQVGDFVELSYLTVGSNLALNTGGWVGRRWYFRAVKTPIYLSLFSLAVPRDSHLQIDDHGSPVKPVFNTENGFNITSWESRAAAQIMPEPSSPAADEYTPFVQVGFDIDWKDYRDVLQIELNEASLPNSELKRFAKKIANSKNPRENVRLIFHKVCSMFRQTGPAFDFSEPATHILARREGNRLVLLVALLRAIGIESRVLLVRTNSDSQIEYKFPNLSTFRHGLVKVELPGSPNPVWLDPSSTFNPFDSLYPFVLGAQAIDINSKIGTAPFVRLPDQYGPILTKNIQLDLSLAADGTLTGTGLERMPTAEAANYRALLTSMSAAQRRQALEAGLGDYFSGAILEGFEIEHLDEPDQALVLKYKLRVPNFARRRGNALVIQEGFYPYRLSRGLTSLPTRTLPLMLGDDTRTQTNVLLSLPSGSTVDLPDRVELHAPLSTFSYSAKLESGLLRIKKSLVVKGGRVSVPDYPAFRDFCNKVDRKDNLEIVISLSGQKPSAAYDEARRASPTTTARANP